MISTDTNYALNDNPYFNSLLREDLYILMACLLVKPPTDDFMKQLAELNWDCEISSTLSSALESLRKAVGCYPVEVIEREFEDLFIGMGRGEMVPYASWYAEKLLMGTPLVLLRSDLAKMGISRQTNVFEPEDHAAALFETMALIIRSPKFSLTQQMAFFCTHIHPWMIQFFRDLKQATSARFYRTVGCLGEIFLHMEYQNLQAK